MAGASFEEQLAEAWAAIEDLRAENAMLRDEIARLKAFLSADSSTTSKLPSTDPVGTRKKRASGGLRPEMPDDPRVNSPGRPDRTWPGEPRTPESTMSRRLVRAAGRTSPARRWSAPRSAK